MMNETEASGLAGRMQNEHSWTKKVSIFWLVAGGLLVFLGVESMLYTANIWTKSDVEYAGDLVLVAIGAIIVASALRPRS